MSTQFYRGLAQLADRAMKRFGMPTNGAYKAFLRRGGTDYPVVALEAAFDPKDVDGQIVLRTDTRYLLSVIDLPFEPSEQTDNFVIKRDAESTEEVWLLPYKPKRIAPGGDAVFFELHCRSQ